MKKLLGRNRAARQQLRTMHLRRKAGEKVAEKLRWKQPQLLRLMARWRRDTRLQRQEESRVAALQFNSVLVVMEVRHHKH